ncbi:MAG: hypothetical protein NE327_05240 [Lentisphaeraceae bacterium]|nr:hypothetical protein [Lentisphaeraceae bacterium]
MKPLNTIQILKSYPKSEAKVIWKESINLFKKEQPKSYLKVFLPILVIMITAIISCIFLGFTAQTNISSDQTKFIAPIAAGLLGGLSAYFSARSLHKQVEPFMKRVIEEREKTR